MSRPTPEQTSDAFKEISILIGNMAKSASDIAHARRTLYNAYLAEGFTEAQSLELCKVLFLS